MKEFLIAVATIMLCLFVYDFVVQGNENPQIKVEYQLEILNQDSVKVYSPSTGRIYVVPFDEVETVLLKDNL